MLPSGGETALPDLLAIRSARARRRRAGRGARPAAALLTVAAIAGVAAWAVMIRMPGASYAGPFAPLSDRERALEAELERDVQELAGDLGDRSLPRPAGLGPAADAIDRALVRAGYAVQRQRYEVRGRASDNLEVEIPGGERRAEIVVVGAHYDSVHGTLGADDNGSGTAALLALARAFAGAHPARTLRFVAFANEEPPYFQTPAMGSVVYARRCRQRGERGDRHAQPGDRRLLLRPAGQPALPFPLRPLLPDHGRLRGVRGQHLLARAGAGDGRRLPRGRPLPLGGGGRARRPQASAGRTTGPSGRRATRR